MRKKLHGGLRGRRIDPEISRCDRGGGSSRASLSGSLQKAEMSGVQRIGGKYYYIDPDTGVRKRGLIRVSGKTYYFTSRWYAVKGFHRVNGRLLFTDARGLVWPGRPAWSFRLGGGIILTRKQERRGRAGRRSVLMSIISAG